MSRISSKAFPSDEAWDPADGRLPPLPSQVKTSLGEIIDTTGSRWIAKRNVHGRGRVIIDIGYLHRPKDHSVARVPKKASPRRKSRLTAELLHLMTLYIAHYLERHEPSSTGTAGLLGAFINFERFLFDSARWGRGNRQIGSLQLTAPLADEYFHYLDSAPPSCARYWSFFRGFYAWALGNRFEGFSFATYRSLRKRRLEKSMKGRVAELRDPIKGAFIWEEEKQIVNAFDNCEGDERDRAITMLFWETGLRPEAAVRLKQQNLQESPNTDSWVLNAPRVKKGRSAKPRDEFKRYVISAELGALLERVCRTSDKTGFLLHWLTDHVATNDVRKAVARWGLQVGLVTTRLSQDGAPTPMPLTPYRFRRALASNMAERGCDQETIADALDDESLAMASIYAANASSIVEVLEATLDRHPAWTKIIRLFLGQVSKNKDADGLPAIYGGVVTLTEFEKYAAGIGIVGWCRFMEPCRWNPPLSCYRCPHFSATDRIEAHEKQLEQLVRDADAGLGIESDRMAVVLLDDMAAILSLIVLLKREHGIATTEGRAPRVAAKIKKAASTGGRHPLPEEEST